MLILGLVVSSFKGRMRAFMAAVLLRWRMRRSQRGSRADTPERYAEKEFGTLR
jgi:hypothetical protein